MSQQIYSKRIYVILWNPYNEIISVGGTLSSYGVNQNMWVFVANIDFKVETKITFCDREKDRWINNYFSVSVRVPIL